MKEVIAYVDGSYQDALKTYAYGCVVFTPEGQVYCCSGSGNNPETAAVRNVAGEMLGAMVAVQWAMKQGYPAIQIRYDYQGIEMWATGRWKTKNDLTRKYAETMRGWGSRIRISFEKIKAHSGDRFNDMADRLAKEALGGQVLSWDLVPELMDDESEEMAGTFDGVIPSRTDDACGSLSCPDDSEKRTKEDGAVRTLEEGLNRLGRSDLTPFHMPGHKRKGSMEETSIRDALAGIARYDITEIDGFDNLHAAEGVLRAEMEAMAAFYGTRSTYILVNGSTCGILAAISAAVPYGGTILIERSSHISVYHAAYMRNLRINYVENERFEEDLAPDAVVITSPSYEGCVKDVAGWAERAHGMGAVLIVDEAHGAHLPYVPSDLHPYFPETAIACGADLVIESAHKTLPSLTQTALLHNVTGKVPDGALQKYLRIYETSSPSYVLMASVTTAFHMCSGNPEMFRDYARNLKYIRGELRSLKVLRLAGGADAVLSYDNEIPYYPAGTVLDPGKLVIITEGAGKSGEALLYDRLRLAFRIQPEMKAPGYVLLMTSAADTREDFEKLLHALREIDRSLDGMGGSEGEMHFAQIIPERRCSMREAYDGASKEVPLCEAEGRISAGFVIKYPPDAPVIVPGEVFGRDTVSLILQLAEEGFALEGITTDGMVSVAGDGPLP